MITPFAGVTPTKAGSATLPFFGVEPVILDENGKLLEGNDVSGLLAIKKPWPSMARTIQGDHQRFLKTYLSVFDGYYFTFAHLGHRFYCTEGLHQHLPKHD